MLPGLPRRPRLLAAELGLDSGPELQRLERAILAEDQALELGDARSSTPIPPSGNDGSPAVSGRRPRRALVWVVAAAAAIAALAIGLGLPFRGGNEVVVVSDSVVKIDAESNKMVASIPVGGQPGRVRVLGDAVFVTSVTNKTLSRIDTRTGELTTSGEYAAGPGIAVGGDWLWVVSERRDVVTRVSPRSLGEIEQIGLGGRPGNLSMLPSHSAAGRCGSPSSRRRRSRAGTSRLISSNAATSSAGRQSARSFSGNKPHGCRSSPPPCFSASTRRQGRRPASPSGPARRIRSWGSDPFG